MAEDRVADLAHAFAGRGRVVKTDRITRELFATDASPYRIVPAAVLRALDVDDVAAAITECSARDISIVARGAGTSLSGQCVGDGLILDCGALDAIEWIDPERRIARVQPGVTWWRLNAAARAYGLEFGPDPATKRQCTIGGMIGSNSGGTHSIVYGATVDHVHAVDAVLADGQQVRLGEGATMQDAGAPPALALTLQRIRRETRGLLGPQFSTLARRGSGYQLEHLCGEKPHLGRLLAGSDGTLGLITAAEVMLDQLPGARVLAAVGFDDMHAALEAVPELVATGPSAVELVSASMVDIARSDRVYAAAVAGVPAEIGALLLVEYSGDSVTEASAGFDRMDAALDIAGGARTRIRTRDAIEAARLWAIREASIGSLASVASGPLLPQAFVEDTTVSVERLPAYIREFERVFDAHGFRAVWYGHASTGLIHVRPFADMTDAGDLRRLEALMADSVDLVRAYGGDLCGEHGNGISRTYWNERLFGTDIYNQLRAIKAAFDPRDVLNPGKVVDGGHPLGPLRYGADYARRAITPSISFEDQGGIHAAVERCFGAGVCRKRDVGTMCPPAAATGLEEHSTRARANLLRSVVSGALEVADLTGAQAREVMETCVGCKACKTECPARVDLARLKVEWMDLIRRREGPTAFQAIMANLRPLAAMGARAPALANAVLRSEGFKRRLGVARTLPQIRRPARLRTGRADVGIFADCFTTYFEPSIATATAELVRATGASVARVRAGCCGRTALSEGFTAKARESATRAARRLRRSSGPILFCEPSCLSMVTDDWPHLIGDVADIVDRAQQAEAWIAANGGALGFEPGGSALLHGHCHQKALWGTGATEAALALIPDLTVEVLDAGCCGMAGGFGYQAARQDLSKAMAERVLLPAVRAAGGETTVVAPGTSCRHQIADLGPREALHPLELLRARLRGTITA